MKRTIELRREGNLWEVLVDGETSFAARECEDQPAAQCAAMFVVAVANRAASFVDEIEEEKRRIARSSSR